MKRYEQTLNACFRRLRLEAALNAAIISAFAALSLACAISVYAHLFARVWQSAYSLFIPCFLFVVLFAVLRLTKYNPRPADMAVRIDETGLLSRVGTMLSFRNSRTVLCELQRIDAQEKLCGISTSSIPFRVTTRALLGCAVLAALHFAMSFAPYGLLPQSNTPALQTKSESYRAMLASLKQSSLPTVADKGDAEALNAYLSALSDMFDETGVQIDQAKDVAKTVRDIKEQLGMLDSYSRLIGGMLLEPRLRSLGAAILARDEDAVKQAIRDMSALLTSREGDEQARLITQTASQIDACLSLTDEDAKKGSLAGVLKDLWHNLTAAALADFSRKIDTDNAIIHALEDAERELLILIRDPPIDETSLNAKTHRESTKKESGGLGKTKAESGDGKSPDMLIDDIIAELNVNMSKRRKARL